MQDFNGTDLWTARDLALDYGVSVKRVYGWRRRYTTFPKPLYKMGRNLLWSMPELKGWALDTIGEPAEL
jgi:predicted DNA-binding transcriptional regulator AlpA